MCVRVALKCDGYDGRWYSGRHIFNTWKTVYTSFKPFKKGHMCIRSQTVWKITWRETCVDKIFKIFKQSSTKNNISFL